MDQKLENEELFKVVKDFHEKEELSNVCAQHPHLLPKLRPYQEKAVEWMVHRETQPVIENTILDYGKHLLHFSFRGLTTLSFIPDKTISFQLHQNLHSLALLKLQTACMCLEFQRGEFYLTKWVLEKQ